MVSKVDVTVIIPTYNRKESLNLTLSSLANQTYPKEKYEVVVVDDGSADDNQLVCQECYPFVLRYVWQENQGSAMARNRGAAEAKGDLFVFVDDDMLLEPDYLAGLVDLHKSDRPIVGMGVSLPYIMNESTIFERIWLGDSERQDTYDREVRFTECVTNNLSIKREDFFRIGQMQDIAGDGPSWWGDVDFGYRAWKAGMVFWRSAKSICYHNDYSTKSLASVVERSEKIARMAVLLWHKYPDIIDYLPMFADKQSINIWKDAPGMVIRKLLRRFSATRVVVWMMEKMAHAIESRMVRLTQPRSLHSRALLPLLRWITGAYIFRGFQDGLRIYGIPTGLLA